MTRPHTVAHALEDGAKPAPVLQQIAAARGVVNELMAGILKSHLREEVSDATTAAGDATASNDSVIGLMRTTCGSAAQPSAARLLTLPASIDQSRELS